MRHFLIVLGMLVCSSTSAVAQVSVGVGVPGLSIGIKLPAYPQLVPVPGYPVYYAPQLDSNYFFYDGMYWVFLGDNWYTSIWYNGPWGLVPPEAVPLFVLRVPVRYYRRPPAYFRGWSSDAPPRWGEHWGHTWEQHRRGWDNWNRSAVPAPAPLPAYQRQYSGSRYPRAEQQQILQSQNYRYRPQDAIVQQHYRAQEAQSAPSPSVPPSQGARRESSSSRQDQRGPNAQPRQPGPTEIQPPLPQARRELQQPTQQQNEQPPQRQAQQQREVQQQPQQSPQRQVQQPAPQGQFEREAQQQRQAQQQAQQRQAQQQPPQQAPQRQAQQQAQQRQAQQQPPQQAPQRQAQQQAQQRQAQQQPPQQQAPPPPQVQRQVPQQPPQHEAPPRQQVAAQHEQQPAKHGQEKNEPRGGEPGK